MATCPAVPGQSDLFMPFHINLDAVRIIHINYGLELIRLDVTLHASKAARPGIMGGKLVLSVEYIPHLRIPGLSRLSQL